MRYNNARIPVNWHDALKVKKIHAVLCLRYMEAAKVPSTFGFVGLFSFPNHFFKESLKKCWKVSTISAQKSLTCTYELKTLRYDYTGQEG